MKQICRLLIVVSFLLNVAPAVLAVTADKVSISPASVESPAVGRQLTVSVEITNGSNVAGYQATVTFDTSALRYVSSANGDYLPTGAFFVPPSVSGNQVTLAATALAGESNGSGTLAKVTFEVIAVKASTLSLSEVVLSDSAGAGFKPRVENGQITKPAPAVGNVVTADKVSISPASVESPTVGAQLTVSLEITNGSNVAGYQATVTFDTSALRYVSSANGDYLPAGAFFVPPSVSGNQVTLAATALAGESNGSGTLAKVTFEVIAVKASTLSLSEVVLSDSAGEGFNPRVENGQITEPAPAVGNVVTADKVSIFPASVESPAVGRQLTVSLEITNGSKVAGYQATVVFDASALRFVEGANGDYLPAGAFFVPPSVSGNQVTLAATALAGESNGSGTLAKVTFEVITVKASTLRLTEVVLSDSAGEGFNPRVENGQITKTSQRVNIPDPNLRAAIEKALGKASGTTITTADMATLTQLEAPNANISDLIGLEHAINLTRLDLGDEYVDGYKNSNSVSDLSPLAGLTNLTILYLQRNNISNISTISGLTNLTSLNLYENNISDISAVSGLTNLTDLRLGKNNVSDISAVSGLTNLTYLSFYENNISDISALSRLTNLTLLDLTLNPISDISALSRLTNLTHLNLQWNNRISDISALSRLTNLTQLLIQGNRISDISVLSSLTNLTTLWISSNSISDISPLSGLTNLTRLWISNNRISDISPLVSNTGLGSGDEVDVRGNPLNAASVNTHIPTLQRRGVTVEFDPPSPVNIPDANLRAKIEEALGKTSGATITTADMATLTGLEAPNANISDLTGLEHAINLTTLGLQINKIVDISSLSGLTNLTSLDLDDNSISDISAVSGLTNLTELGLTGNSISDISAVSGLTNLIYLGLYVNNISDISAVSGLIRLTVLDLGSNTISDISPLAGLTNLASLDLLVNAISDISPLAALTNLTSLGLQGNSISDISPLAALTNLTSLGLQGNSISDISPLAALTNLRQLFLSHNTISDLPSLDGLTSLKDLHLENNTISDISSLAGLTNLRQLFLSENAISDISSLAGLTNLTWLGFWRNSISDLSSLVANTGLGSGDTVYLRENPLNAVSVNTHIPTLQRRGVEVHFDAVVAQTVNIPDPNLRAAIEAALEKAAGTPLTADDMATLTRLDAPNADIKDLTGLEHATNLTELSLDNNGILDLSSLVSNTGLGDGDKVNVKGNPLNAVSINTHIPTLQQRGVEVQLRWNSHLLCLNCRIHSFTGQGTPRVKSSVRI